MGTRAARWQKVDEVLGRSAESRKQAVARYREFVTASWNQGRRDELTGGRWIRSAGGRDEVVGRRPEDREAADQRILGRGEFVEGV